jgi:hypothetical protein
LKRRTLREEQVLKLVPYKTLTISYANLMYTGLLHHKIGGSIDSAFSVWASCIGRLKQAGSAKCVEAIGCECAEVEDTSSEVDGTDCPGLKVLCPGMMVLCPGLNVLSVLG